MLNNMSKRTKLIITALILITLFTDIYFDRRPLWKGLVTRVVLIGIELPQSQSR